MSTDRDTDQQTTDAELSEVSPFTERRRRELARELREELDERGVRLLQELVQSPSTCWLTSEYRHSRGRNAARHAVPAAFYELLADRAGGLEDPVEAARRLMLARAEVDAVVTLLIDRVLGLGEDEPVDLQTAFDFEAREGAEEDVATIEALADDELDVEELRRIEEQANSARAALRMKVRAVQRKRVEMERGAA